MPSYRAVAPRPSRALHLLCALVFAVACTAPVDDDAELGRSEAAILRGREAQAEEGLGTVAVLAYTEDAAWGCSGTLVAPQVIVTAAHCVLDDADRVVDARDLEVVAGAPDLRSYDRGESYVVARVAAHERAFRGFTSGDPSGLGVYHDIALLELERPVTQLAPVPVLPMRRVDAELRDGSPLVIAGYGTRFVHEDGTSDGDGILFVGDVTWKRRSEGEFLAGDATESDTCPGDSGGPVYARVDGRTYLVGATSRGRDDFRDVDCGQGGIYTLVPAYAPWIAMHTTHHVELALGEESSLDADDQGDGLADGASLSPTDRASTASIQGAELRSGGGCSVGRADSRRSLGVLGWLLVALLGLRVAPSLTRACSTVPRLRTRS